MNENEFQNTRIPSKLVFWDFRIFWRNMIDVQREEGTDANDKEKRKKDSQLTVSLSVLFFLGIGQKWIKRIKWFSE